MLYIDDIGIVKKPYYHIEITAYFPGIATKISRIPAS